MKMNKNNIMLQFLQNMHGLTSHYPSAEQGIHLFAHLAYCSHPITKGKEIYAITILVIDPFVQLNSFSTEKKQSERKKYNTHTDPTLIAF